MLIASKTYVKHGSTNWLTFCLSDEDGSISHTARKALDSAVAMVAAHSIVYGIDMGFPCLMDKEII